MSTEKKEKPKKNEKLEEMFLILNDKPIIYHRVYAEITGSVTSGLLLSQIIYWSRAMLGKEFYKTNKDFCDELGMGVEEFKSAKKKIAKFVTLTAKGVPRKTYYKLNISDVMESMLSWQETRQLVGGKHANCKVEITPTITESKTENTQIVISEPSSEDEKQSATLEASCHAVTTDSPPVPPTPQDVPFDNTPINLMPELQFDSKEEIRKMIYGTETKKPQKHIAIIGMYIMAKRYKIESKEMLATLISGRNCKAAKLLTVYPTKQIWDTMIYLQGNADFKWTLESVDKYILDLDNLKNNKSQTPKAFGEGLEIKKQ